MAKGFQQQLGIDYDATFSPVIKPTTIWTILVYAHSYQWPIQQLDINNAFLHEQLSEEVYMIQPPSYIDRSYPDHVCLLQKSLYGLKQKINDFVPKKNIHLNDFL